MFLVWYLQDAAKGTLATSSPPRDSRSASSSGNGSPDMPSKPAARTDRKSTADIVRACSFAIPSIDSVQSMQQLVALEQEEDRLRSDLEPKHGLSSMVSK
eukprot:gene19154-22899_t